MKIIKQLALMVLTAALLISCGGQNSDNAQESEANNNENSIELTDFQMEHGIGPVTEPVELGNELDPEMVKKGAKFFELKCSACHRLDSRYIGPPLDGITSVRTPAYIMNMILNPAEMIEKHPIPKALRVEYISPMTNQNLSREEARAVVEYLASEDRKE